MRPQIRYVTYEITGPDGVVYKVPEETQDGRRSWSDTGDQSALLLRAVDRAVEKHAVSIKRVVEFQAISEIIWPVSIGNDHD